MWQSERPFRRGAMSGWVRAAWMVVLALSLVLMHGLGLSHTAPVESVAAATVSAQAIPSGGHVAPTGSDAPTGFDASAHQDREPGHAEALAQTCMAVLTALVLVFAFFVLTTRRWPWHGRRLRAIRTQRFWDRPMWWVHPRAHALCVMRT